MSSFSLYLILKAGAKNKFTFTLELKKKKVKKGLEKFLEILFFDQT